MGKLRRGRSREWRLILQFVTTKKENEKKTQAARAAKARKSGPATSASILGLGGPSQGASSNGEVKNQAAMGQVLPHLLELRERLLIR
jgi:hypothetical protein